MKRTNETKVTVEWVEFDQGIAQWLASGPGESVHPYHGNDTYLTRLHGSSQNNESQMTRKGN
jgi:hypothetical protein